MKMKSVCRATALLSMFVAGGLYAQNPCSRSCPLASEMEAPPARKPDNIHDEEVKAFADVLVKLDPDTKLWRDVKRRKHDPGTYRLIAEGGRIKHEYANGGFEGRGGWETNWEINGTINRKDLVNTKFGILTVDFVYDYVAYLPLVPKNAGSVEELIKANAILSDTELHEAHELAMDIVATKAEEYTQKDKEEEQKEELAREQQEEKDRKEKLQRQEEAMQRLEEERKQEEAREQQEREEKLQREKEAIQRLRDNKITFD